MNETRQEAPGTFLAGSDATPPGIDLSPGVREPSVREQGAASRRRHRRRRMRVLVPAGAVAVAAGVTAALLAASASPPPSALAAVTSALAKTSAGSYSFSVDSTVRFNGRELNSDVVSGAFDPGHELGTELLLTTRLPQHRPVRAQIRFIGEYVYGWMSPGSGIGTTGKPWNKAPVPPSGADVMPPGDVYGFVTDQPVSPAELSGVLRSAAVVRDGGAASGPGWTGTRYAFTARFLNAREYVSGTVYVDQQGRVRRLVTITTQGLLTMDRDLTFGDFGVPVTATAPPPSQVSYTSKPYWGFFF
jgi:hypothetical protein